MKGLAHAPFLAAAGKFFRAVCDLPTDCQAQHLFNMMSLVALVLEKPGAAGCVMSDVEPMPHNPDDAAPVLPAAICAILFPHVHELAQHPAGSAHT